ncbi:MAG: hypothetical protein JWQ27_487 [Ferruginibacter sp.]|nr:hypothetical protein [Ferruginibacter sp.]
MFKINFNKCAACLKAILYRPAGIFQKKSPAKTGEYKESTN